MSVQALPKAGGLTKSPTALLKKMPAMPAVSTFKTKKTGLIALASAVAMTLGITAISNRKSLQSGASNLYKKIEVKAKQLKKSVSDFVKQNPKAVAVTAVATAAGICVAGAKLLEKNPYDQAFALRQKENETFAQNFAELTEPMSPEEIEFAENVPRQGESSPVLGINDDGLALAIKLGEIFPGQGKCFGTAEKSGATVTEGKPPAPNVQKQDPPPAKISPPFLLTKAGPITEKQHALGIIVGGLSGLAIIIGLQRVLPKPKGPGLSMPPSTFNQFLKPGQ